VRRVALPGKYDYRVIVRQISIQITAETARQIADLAARWGLPSRRHNTPVVERAVATIYMLEVGYDEYRRRMIEMTGDDPESETF
jgi:hypothetical protein